MKYYDLILVHRYQFRLWPGLDPSLSVFELDFLYFCDPFTLICCYFKFAFHHLYSITRLQTSSPAKIEIFCVNAVML